MWMEKLDSQMTQEKSWAQTQNEGIFLSVLKILGQCQFHKS